MFARALIAILALVWVCARSYAQNPPDYDPGPPDWNYPGIAVPYAGWHPGWADTGMVADWGDGDYARSGGDTPHNRFCDNHHAHYVAVCWSRSRGDNADWCTYKKIDISTPPNGQTPGEVWVCVSWSTSRMHKEEQSPVPAGFVTGSPGRSYTVIPRESGGSEVVSGKQHCFYNSDRSPRGIQRYCSSGISGFYNCVYSGPNCYNEQ
jgi:hypothetical protein